MYDFRCSSCQTPLKSQQAVYIFISGLFFAQSDVGIGTIVGSAVFNILFIVAMCGLFSGMVSTTKSEI